ADLRAVAGLPHDHDALDRLAPGQELRLGDDRHAAAALLTPLASALLLGLQAGRSLDRLHAVRGRLALLTLLAGLADLDHRALGIVRAHRGLGGLTAATAAATAAARPGGD